MKKGFTLIELLAVLVILVVIAAIATPIVMGIINEAKVSADISTINNILDTAEQFYAQAYLNGDLDEVVGKNLLEHENFKMDNQPENAIVTFDEEGNTTVVYYSNEFCYVKKPGVDITYGESSFEKCDKSFVGDNSSGDNNGNNEDNLEILTIGDIVYFNPETNETCTQLESNSDLGTKTGCMAWYIYNVNNDGTYQVILDHNTTKDTSDCLKPAPSLDMPETSIGINYTLIADVETWNTNLNARLITLEEITELTNASSYSYISDDYQWLYSSMDSDDSCYWTSTMGGVFNLDQYTVNFNGYIDVDSCPTYAGYCGIRPVITVELTK